MNQSLKDKTVVIISNSIPTSVREVLVRLEVRVLIVGNFSEDLPWIVDRISPDGLSDGEIVEAIVNTGLEPDAICVFSDRNVHMKSVLCKYFGLPFIEESQVETVVEKNKMREMFIKNAPEITPQFSLVENIDDVKKFIDTYGFPVMLKPASLDRSLLIARADTLDEACEVFENISNRITDIYKKRNSRNKPHIIIEEYMTGFKYSVDGVVDSSGVLHTPGTVTDLWFGYDVGINDPLNHLRITPSLQPTETVNQLIECAEKAVKALGLKSCPIHAELIMTKGKAKIIEIAARLGGFREEMYKTSLGISLLEADLKMQVFDDASIVVGSHSRYTAAIKVYALKEGKFSSISNIESLKDYKSYMYSQIKYDYGEMVGPSRLGYSEVLYVYISCDDREGILHDSEKIIRETIAYTE